MVTERTDSEWHTFLEGKIAQVLNTQTDPIVGPLASITSPEDPRFSLAIDHTLLKQDATPLQIDALCDDAIKHGFKVRQFPFSKVKDL
jgi:deoxyribose-phosphate aldolase